jgi:hypothetical protein
VGREQKTGASGAQAALTVIVAIGTGLAALLLRPNGGLLDKGTGPFHTGTAVVVLLAVGWVVVAALVGRRYRELIRQSQYLSTGDRELGPVEHRLADSVRWILLAVPLAVPLLLLLMHPLSTGAHTTENLQAIPKQKLLPPVAAQQSDGHDSPHPFWFYLLIGLGILLVLGILAFVIVYLWREFRLPHLSLRRSEPAADDDDEDEDRKLAQAVLSGRRALREGHDARAAVIACYAAMEESLSVSGVVRRVSDSPQDLLERAASGGLLTGAAAGDLTSLFREARYSTHPMDAGHRERASAALDEIAAQLDRYAAAAAEAAAQARSARAAEAVS